MYLCALHECNALWGQMRTLEYSRTGVNNCKPLGGCWRVGTVLYWPWSSGRSANAPSLQAIAPALLSNELKVGASLARGKIRKSVLFSYWRVDALPSTKSSLTQALLPLGFFRMLSVTLPFTAPCLSLQMSSFCDTAAARLCRVVLNA